MLEAMSKHSFGGVDMPIIDIAHIPFSRYGAYVSVTSEKNGTYLCIRNVRRRDDDEAFELRFLSDGIEVPFEVTADSEAIRITAGIGNAIIYIRDDRCLAIDSAGIDLQLMQISAHGYGIQKTDMLYQMIDVPHRLFALIHLQAGSASLKGPVIKDWRETPVDRRQILHVSCVDGKALVCMKLSNQESKEIKTPIDTASDLRTIEREWEIFRNKMPQGVQAHRMAFAEVTWYNLWSCFVRAEDVYHFDAMLMSKKSMCSVWSWDHCFNAMVMSYSDVKAGLEQFLLPFELQSECGSLPDMWNPNMEVVWGVTKPPVHGWCFGKMMDRIDFPEEILHKVYSHLEKWTNWWFEYRDSDNDGIPEYPMGCDSGWDNSTIFDHGYFVESPDLCAYLVLQMDTLSRIALNLGDARLSQEWKARSGVLLATFCEHSWKNERFVAPLSGSHEYDEIPTSLLSLMPLVLGERLDSARFNCLVKTLETCFLTENGPATEALESRFYNRNGYWRGPIWAPSTYMIVDGLLRGGKVELAHRIAKGYCDMSQYRAKGNYENFDAILGTGLCAPGYTWSASVYMLFASELSV